MKILKLLGLQLLLAATVSAQTNTFPSSGNTGIGTLSPTEKLAVFGGHDNTRIGLHYNHGNDLQNADLLIWASEPGWSYTGAGMGNNVQNSIGITRISTARGASYMRLLDQEIKFNVIKTDGTDISAVTINSNGNVGIGTTAPSEKLEVNGYLKLGDAQNYMYGGQDASGTFIEQVGNTAAKSAMRIQSSKTGDASNYAYISISPYAGIAFNHIGNGNSNVGIGTGPSATEKLAVNGKIRAKEIKVESNPATWPDYVFEEGYPSLSLAELEKFIKLNKHLPEMPSAKQVGENGIELGEMNKLLLKKVEEITLLLIEKEKGMLELTKRLERLEEKAKNN